RRADRQPRLDDERRDPRAAPDDGRVVRPDDGHGHARPAGGRDRAPHPLPLGRADRPRHGAAAARRRYRRHGRADPAMIGVAVKGLLGRKTRALLTALAIILGVSMVSGTYVLTDTINKAFTGVLVSTYKDTSVVISGK